MDLKTESEQWWVAGLSVNGSWPKGRCRGGTGEGVAKGATAPRLPHHLYMSFVLKASDTLTRFFVHRCF